METYRTWLRLFELLRYYSWIVDRFHISTRAYQLQAHGKDYDFSWLETRLVGLGFRLVFCTRSVESFAQARAERLEVSGNPEQYTDLDRFIREQQLFRKPVEESALPTLEVDVSDSDVGRATTEIADWMEATGGLWAGD